MAKVRMEDVASWTRKNKDRQRKLAQNVVRRLGEIAQRPVAAGGRMPVLTGALTASFTAYKNGALVAEGPLSYLSVAARVQPGDRISFSWGNEMVKYAAPQNFGWTSISSNGAVKHHPGKHWLEWTVAQFGDVFREEAIKLGARP